MENILNPKSFLTCIVGIFFLIGCSSSNQASESSDPVFAKQERAILEIRHDRALQHFIEAAALDAKGSFAEAILEYQEALKAEPNASIYYAISKDYLQLNKIGPAVENANEAVRLEPGNISYRENLGSIFFNASQVDLAIREYEEIVKIDSNYTAGWLTLARLYQITQPQKALDVYEKMLQRNGGQLEIMYQSAQIYMALERFDDAASKYKQMIEIDPNNKQLKKQLAETLAKAGKFDESRMMLETMIEADSSDIEVIAALADVYMDQKQFKNAINLYERLLNSGIKSSEIKLRIGVGLFGLTEHDSTLVPKTIDLFEDLQKDAPADWRPYWYLGAIATSQHKDSLAEVYFNQVTKLEKNQGDAWWLLGSSLFEQGKYEKLLGIMEQAQKFIPNDFRFFLLQGLAFTRMEKQEEAVLPLEKAYELNPKDLNTLSTLAMILDGLQRYNRSDSLYEEGLRQDPKSALLLNNYGYSLAERGLQLQRALEMSKQAVTTEPDNAAYLDTYGWIFYRLEKYEDAALYIEKSIATGNASSVVHEHLGDIFLELGKKQKAMELWKKSLEMDPKNEAAKNKLEHGVN